MDSRMILDKNLGLQKDFQPKTESLGYVYKIRGVIPQGQLRGQLLGRNNLLNANARPYGIMASIPRTCKVFMTHYYGLPVSPIRTQVSSWPDGVQFELCTLPVQAKLVGDGDGMTVHVNITDPKELSVVPLEILEATIDRREARAARDYVRADALHNFIISAGYRIVAGDILAKEYHIRLRGIDAPEMSQKFGEEAKDALRRLVEGKPLKILVYHEDPYGRLVGDVYCHGVFVQEVLLKAGYAWHYNFFDKRPVFAQWQKEAKNHRRGLWSDENPLAPWEHKRRERKGKIAQTPHQDRWSKLELIMAKL